MKYRIKPKESGEGYAISLPFFYDGSARLEVQQSSNGTDWEFCFLAVISGEDKYQAIDITAIEDLVESANQNN